MSYNDGFKEFISDCIWEDGYYNAPEKINLEDAEKALTSLCEEWDHDWDDTLDGVTAADYMEVWNENVDIWNERNQIPEEEINNAVAEEVAKQFDEMRIRQDVAMHVREIASQMLKISELYDKLEGIDSDRTAEWFSNGYPFHRSLDEMWFDVIQFAEKLEENNK